MQAKPYIGRSVPRLEDPPLVRGLGRFAGDISFPHQLHMRLARSPVAHGRIVTIDAAAARATPGVVAVWTAADIADVPPIDVELIDSGHHPSGVGEPASTVVAPAVANAIYNAVGVRVRHMPITAEAVLAGFKKKR